MGLGSAYCDGFNWALSRDYNKIIQIDADFSHNPKYLSNMLETSSNYDLVTDNILSETDLNYLNSRLVGIYDPQDHSLNIDMWSSSDGSEIKNSLEKINTLQLSDFSEKILDIALLTNSSIYFFTSLLRTPAGYFLLFWFKAPILCITPSTSNTPGLSLDSLRIGLNCVTSINRLDIFNFYSLQ